MSMARPKCCGATPWNCVREKIYFKQNKIRYDRACEFKPFRKNLAKNKNIGANLLDKIGILVDIFLAVGLHRNVTLTSRTQQVDIMSIRINPTCEHRCAEQCFVWLGKFKHPMKSHCKYLKKIIESPNQKTIKKENLGYSVISVTADSGTCNHSAWTTINWLATINSTINCIRTLMQCYNYVFNNEWQFR